MTTNNQLFDNPEELKTILREILKGSQTVINEVPSKKNYLPTTKGLLFSGITIAAIGLMIFAGPHLRPSNKANGYEILANDKASAIMLQEAAKTDKDKAEQYVVNLRAQLSGAIIKADDYKQYDQCLQDKINLHLDGKGSEAINKTCQLKNKPIIIGDVASAGYED